MKRVFIFDESNIAEDAIALYEHGCEYTGIVTMVMSGRKKDSQTLAVMSTEQIIAQFEEAVTAGKPDAVKIGRVASLEQWITIMDLLDQFHVQKIVCDVSCIKAISKDHEELKKLKREVYQSVSLFVIDRESIEKILNEKVKTREEVEIISMKFYHTLKKPVIIQYQFNSQKEEILFCENGKVNWLERVRLFEDGHKSQISLISTILCSELTKDHSLYDAVFSIANLPVLFDTNTKKVEENKKNDPFFHKINRLFRKASGFIGQFIYREGGFYIYEVTQDFYEMFGYEKEEYKNGIFISLASEYREEYIERIRRRVVAGENISLIYPAMTKQGEKKWIDIRGTKMKEENGAPVYMALFLDITEQEKQRQFIEKELKRAINAEKTVRLEKELKEQQSKLLISQINPHFMFNTLNVIKFLAISDGRRACELINDFSKYLRSNINAMKSSHPIPFRKEWEHILAYYRIEKMRFKKIELETDFEEVEFMVLPMMILPLVENAIVHGICKKEGMGKIRVSTKKEGDSILIVVEDNGVGFDVKEMKTNIQPGNSNNNTLQSLAYRLEKMNGKMEIQSKKGTGTKIILYIPE